MVVVKISADLLAVLEGRFGEVNPHLAPTGLDNFLTRIAVAYGEIPTSNAIQNMLVMIQHLRIVLSASSKLPVHLRDLDVDSVAGQVIGYSLRQVLAGNAIDQSISDVERDLADVFRQWIAYLQSVVSGDYRALKSTAKQISDSTGLAAKAKQLTKAD